MASTAPPSPQNVINMNTYTIPPLHLSSPQLLFSVVVLLVVIPLFIILYNISPLHPLSSYPGPLSHRASRLPWIISLQRGNLPQHLHHLHTAYGPIVRIAPNELSYTTPSAWKDIYTNPTLERNRIWFKPQPGDPNSIMGYNESDHARYRRALMPAFTDKALRDQAATVESHVDLFITQLRSRASTHQPVDLVSWFNFLTFDISGLLCFGESFDSVSTGRAHPWVSISCNFGKGIALLASLNFLGLTSIGLGRLLKHLMPRAVRERMLYHRQLTAQKVHQYLASPTRPQTRADFFDTILKFNESTKHLQKDGRSPALTTQEMEINLSILIFAASETTSSALSATIHYLLRHPQTLHKATREVRTTFPTESDITFIPPSHSPSTATPYLTSCISESLRLAPAVPIGLPRVTTGPHGAHICDRHVPPHTLVALNQYPANRSPHNFTRPNDFLPERFLSATHDPSSPRHGAAADDGHDDFSTLQPFGLGRHQCIGMRFAHAELRLVLARLLWAFDLQLATAPHPKDFGHQKVLFFWEKEPLLVRLTARAADARKER